MFCPQCGTESKHGANFCHACGKPLETAQELTATAPAATPVQQVARPDQPDLGLHPWRRFFARTIDLLILAAPLSVALFFGLIAVLPGRAEQIVGTLSNPIVAAVLTYLLWVPAEAALLANFGTTPAKWIFGIRVLKFDGRKLTFAEALKRATFACIYGDGFGIPGAALFTRAFAYDKLKKTGTTKWDMIAGSAVQHRKWGVVRGIGATAIVAAALIVFSVLTAMEKKQERSIAATPGHAQSESRSPAAQSSTMALSTTETNNEVARQAPAAQFFDQEKYHKCLKDWHAKNRKEWVEYVKRRTNLEGEVTLIIYWPIDALACDPFGNHAAEPEFRDGKLDWGEFCISDRNESCDANLAQRKRQSEEYVSALDSGREDYQHCIQKWQGDHHGQWLEFKNRWRAEGGSGALKATAYIARPDLKACESRIPVIH